MTQTASSVAQVLRDKGFEPIPVKGKKASSGWRTNNVWDWSGATGVAIRLGAVIAIDIDVPSDDVTTLLYEATIAVAGKGPVRFGSKGCAIFYRCAETVKKQKTGKGVEGEVEILADGQYCVVWGEHPDGMQYDSDVEIPEWELPLITPERIAKILQKSREILGIAPPKSFSSGALPLRQSQILENMDLTEYDNWIKAGQVVHYHYQGAAAGLELWDKHSSEFGSYQVGACAKKWDTFDHEKEGGRTSLAGLGADDDWAEAVTRDKSGRVIDNESNLIKIIEGHKDLTGKLQHNQRSLRKVWVDVPPWRDSKGDLTDVDITNCTAWLQEDVKILRLSKGRVRDALARVAAGAGCDPFKDWLQALQWDGTARLGDWLATAVGCEQSAYTDAIGRRWLISAVARTMAPGCKVDTVLVLIGGQGIGKSTTFTDLVPGDEYYSDSAISAGRVDKDNYMALHGPVIYELQEIDRYTGRGDHASEMKTYISTREDRFRVPYGSEVIGYKRRCVIVGTTNEKTFLTDATGNRRFWPVVAGQCDTEWTRANRDQLWAEALALYLQGEQWHLTDAEEQLAGPVQQTAAEQDPWVERLAMSLHQGDGLTKPGRFGPQPIPWLPTQQGADGKVYWITLSQALQLIGEGKGSSSVAGKRMQRVLQALNFDQGKQIKSRQHGLRDVRPWNVCSRFYSEM